MKQYDVVYSYHSIKYKYPIVSYPHMYITRISFGNMYNNRFISGIFNESKEIISFSNFETVIKRMNFLYFLYF